MLKSASKRSQHHKSRHINSKHSKTIKKSPLTRLSHRHLSTQPIQPEEQSVSVQPDHKNNVSTHNVPLNQPIKLPSQTPTSTTAPQKNSSLIIPADPNVTVLQNKIKVFTQASTVPLSQLQITIKVGSNYESNNESSNGYTNFLAQLLTNVVSTPEWEFSEELAKQGTSIEILADREFLTIRASTAANYKPILEAMADLVINDAWKFLCDFDEEKATYTQTFEYRNTDPGQRFQDDIHYGAFFAKGLGNPVHGTPDHIEFSSVLRLDKWQKRFFVGNRMLIGGFGVDEAEFPKVVNDIFGDVGVNEEHHQADHPEREDFILVHIHNKLDNFDPDNDLQHVSVGWHGPDVRSPFIVPMTVLRVLLGEAAEWSSGGPGKGMYSRMTTNVVSRHDYITQASTFFLSHRHTSLFGIYGMVPAAKTGDFIEVVMNELTNLPATLTELEVNRAKNQLKRQLLLHYQDNSTRLHEMSMSLANFDMWIGPKYLQMIDECTLEQVRQSAELLFDRNSAVITTLGSPEHVPKEFETRDILDDLLLSHANDLAAQHAQKEQQKVSRKQSSMLDGLKSLFGMK